MKKLLLLVILATLASCGGKKDKIHSLVTFFEGGEFSSRTTGPFKQYKVRFVLQNSDGTVTSDNTYTRDTLSFASLQKVSVATATSIDGTFSAPLNENLAIVTFNGYYKDLEDGVTYEVVRRKDDSTGLYVEITNTLPTNYDNNSVVLVDLAKFDKLFPSTFSMNDITSYLESSKPLSIESYNSGSSGTTVFKDSSGNYYLSEDGETLKDVESIGARIESEEVESVKLNLLSYGLSVERTEKLAKLMTAYKKISNKRALNASEKDRFTKELLGMTFNQAAERVVEDYDGLIETAADKNGASPEAVRELVNEFLTK